MLYLFQKETLTFYHILVGKLIWKQKNPKTKKFKYCKYIIIVNPSYLKTFFWCWWSIYHYHNNYSIFHNNVGTIAQLHNYCEKEMAVVLFWLYITSAFFISIWATIALYLLWHISSFIILTRFRGFMNIVIFMSLNRSFKTNIEYCKYANPVCWARVFLVNTFNQTNLFYGLHNGIS